MDESSFYPRELGVSPGEGDIQTIGKTGANLFKPQYIGLQILEKLITTKWKSLPEGQRQGMSHPASWLPPVELVVRYPKFCCEHNGRNRIR